jgi:hypothetical protein
MDEGEFTEFKAWWGGDGNTKEWYVQDFLRHPEHEARLCDHLDVLTEEQRRTESLRASSQVRMENGTTLDCAICWAGPLAKEAGAALYEWLPRIIPGISVWYSPESIGTGKPWFDELMQNLRSARSCILCLTPQSLGQPWIYFEAGVLARDRNARVISYLVGLESSALKDGPLHHFQVATADQASTLKLVKDLSKSLRPDKDFLEIQSNFTREWAKLKTILSGLEDEVLHLGSEPIRSRNANIDRLSPHARTLLIEAAEPDAHGTVMMIGTMLSTSVQAGGKQLIDSDDAENIAEWREAIEQLVQEDLLEDRVGKGEIFHLTAAGYRRAKRLRTGLAASSSSVT